ncbi:tetratricopeptide repeat protein [uncultured Polaribacter sp.]|uniref:tetratricopeptide repeat protein n=1 Tax=uncultured Polaribacter sp. TaxID=174711 RepID=UPI00263483C7|nr:tetratricopeptide repeat protein [uncultured Polaribacter sp.]
MKTNTFINILKKNIEIQQIETAELKSVVEEFPYFQSARALYLKGLKNQDSFKYNNELKVTAAYTTDRTVLFNFITSFNPENKDEENIHQQITAKIADEIPAKKEIATLSNNTNETAEKIVNVKENLELGKPLSFSVHENYSFNQWLQLSTKKPIVRVEEKTVQKVVKAADLIDKFIQNNPKIEPIEKGKTVSVPVRKNKQDVALMTETLAKVYLEQKKYENAIQAYRILILKYPEKSGFFADQIKRIQILQKNRS